MKRILLVFYVLIGIQSNAQICTPDTATPSLAAIGYPSLEWSGMWVNGETPSFACDSTQPMMNLEAVVGQPFEATLTGMLGDTFPSGGLLVPTVESSFLYTTAIPSWLTWDALDSTFYPGPANKTCIKLSGTPSLADTTYWIPSVGVESGFWTSWYQVAGSMFGFPAIDTFAFCHNVRVFKDYTDIDESDLTAMSIAPNPANDYLKINFNKAVVSEEFIGRIKVYNVIGNEVYVQPNIEASNSVGFEISSLPGGNYWITIDLGVGMLREEFVIVH
ncbi:MAG: T9SS type A sorting domain-containing protein [Schleiferiaceae bacterium]|nr:T9SS type A sorting domain-containing protein [Schleiferiaceae bacterium]MDG1918548.1 T9SS type A sorting domain-containing protein [Schleiferiaceae bacterium]